MTSSASDLANALRDRYRIERELGQGGMATVYLARDLKHNRDVAIKVLRAELAGVLGAERFLAEIQVTARLDHPHILTLIDSGATDGHFFYVIPFVRGESLRTRLERERQLPLEQALTITRQVAGALDYAHRNGVIHRDIKPENILLHEGEAMLTDFGIALAVAESRADRLTQTGLSLGTPQYMSPEQATGERELDARADVYSLGAVLYEMLAGEPPVRGATHQAMIAKLLTEHPVRLRVIRRELPQSVDDAVTRALAKSPADRFQTAREFSTALASTTTATSTPAPIPTVRLATPAPRRRITWIVAVAALALAVGAFAAYRATAGRSPAITIGRSEQLTADAGLEIQPAISPDGKLVAYAAGNAATMRIFIRPVGGGRTIPLSDDSTSVETSPRWSDDGKRLLFLSHGGVSIASALGGASEPVVPPSPSARVITAAWAPGGREIAFTRGESLYVASLGGGAPRLLSVASNTHSCDWSPDGKWIACVTDNAESVQPGESFGNRAPSGIHLYPAQSGAPVLLLPQGRAVNTSPIWWPDGSRLLFISNRDGPSDVYAVALSAAGRARGEPTRLTTGLGANTISVSGDGRQLAYAVYTARANIWSLPVPTAGAPVTTDGATALTTGNQVIEAVGLSRDGRWLLYDSDLRGNADIYRIPLTGGPPEQLTSVPSEEFAPSLSPDGRLLAYHSWRTGSRDIEVKPLDGGPVQSVTATPGHESYPTWSPNGRELAFVDQRSQTLFVLRRDSSSGGWSEPEPLAVRVAAGSWSPDSRSIAYFEMGSTRAGPVMIVPRAGGAPRRLFDTSATAPAAAHVEWSRDGRTLYYKAHDAEGNASFWSVPAAGGKPRLLVQFGPDRRSSRKDFATDGRNFYFAVNDRQSDVFVAELLTR